MSIAKKIDLLQYVFQVIPIELVSVINNYHIKELHLFWDTQYIKLNYSFILTYDLEVKGIKKTKYFLSFSEEKHGQERGTNYQVLGKY